MARAVSAPAADAMWVFEPHVAEAVSEDLLREHGIPVRREARLDREHGVALEGTRITSITTLDAEAGNRAVAGDSSPSEPSGPRYHPQERAAPTRAPVLFLRPADVARASAVLAELSTFRSR